MNKLSCVVLTSVLWSCAAPASQPQNDLLPSWNDGPAKKSIIAFVERVSKAGGPDFVDPAQRIAPSTTMARCGPSNPSTFSSFLPSIV